MARIRTIKPEFWQDEDLALLDAEVRLLAIGLLNHADDEGYFKAHPALVKAVVFPFTEDSLNIHGMLKQLEKASYLRLFEGSNGKNYGKVIGFEKHQKVNRPSPSKIKEFEPITEDSLNAHGALIAGKEQGTGNREHDNNNKTPTKSDKPKTRKTRLKDNFDLPVDWSESALAYWAKNKRTDLDPQTEFESFKNHHIAKASTSADWKRSWSTWCSNAMKFNRPLGGGYETNRHQQLSTVEAATQHNAEYAARLESEIQAARAGND